MPHQTPTPGHLLLQGTKTTNRTRFARTTAQRQKDENSDLFKILRGEPTGRKNPLDRGAQFKTERALLDNIKLAFQEGPTSSGIGFGRQALNARNKFKEGQEEAFETLRHGGLGSELQIILDAQKRAKESDKSLRNVQVPLGGGRPGTTKLQVGGQGANAQLQNASNELQRLIDFGSPLAQFLPKIQKGFKAKQQENTERRNRTLSFTIPFRSNQRRAIVLSQQVQTGRRKRRSGSTTIPLAAGLLTSRRRNVLT